MIFASASSAAKRSGSGGSVGAVSGAHALMTAASVAMPATRMSIWVELFTARDGPEMIMLLAVVDDSRPPGVERFDDGCCGELFCYRGVPVVSRHACSADAPRIVLANPFVGEAFDVPAVEDVPGGIRQAMLVIESGATFNRLITLLDPQG